MAVRLSLNDAKPSLPSSLAMLLAIMPGVSTNDVKARKLQDFCKKAGGSIKTPKLITSCLDFPRQDNGKVQKNQLRDQYLRRTQPAAPDPTSAAR